jgi:hypothetical protein
MDESNDKRETFLRWAALSIIGICFLYLFMVTFLPMFYPTKFENNYSNTAAGIILLLLGYYWGSSSGSAAKSQTLEKELVGANPPLTTRKATFTSTETIDKTTEVLKPVATVEEKKEEVKTVEVK